MPKFMRVCFVLAAIVLAALALGLTLTFYTGYAQTPAEAAILVTLCVMSFATKFLAPAGVKYVRGHVIVQLMLWVGFVAAVVFDSFGTAGFWEITYGTKSSAVITQADDYKKAEKAKADAADALSEYSGTRPTAEVQVELDNEKLAAGACTARRAHTDACKNVAALELELARAVTRDERQTTFKKAASEFDTMKKPSASANPQRAVLTKLGGYIGVSDAGSFVSPTLSVLTFIFVEIVAPTMFFVAVHGGSSKPPLKIPDKPPAAPRLPLPVSSRRRSPAAPRGVAADGVLTFLAELVDGARTAPGLTVTGRRVSGSQRAIGQACAGLSGATVNRHLAALKDAGAIALSVGPGGTVIDVL